MIKYCFLEATTINLVIPLYEKMINENAAFDNRLDDYQNKKIDLHNMLLFSLNREDDLFMLVYKSNHLIGFIDSAKILCDQYEWFIKSVYFLPSYRNEILFQNFIQFLENIIKGKGITVIKNNALMNGRIANSIWEKCGYKIEGGFRKKFL